MSLLDDAKGSFFDPIADALKETVGIYSQYSAIKLNNQVAKAQLSAASAAMPTPNQDAQAIAQSTMEAARNNKLLVAACVFAGAIALYVIVKK